jgi:hypothetical protein
MNNFLAATEFYFGPVYSSYTQRHNSLSIFGRIVDIKAIKKLEEP